MDKSCLATAQLISFIGYGLIDHARDAITCREGQSDEASLFFIVVAEAALILTTLWVALVLILVALAIDPDSAPPIRTDVLGGVTFLLTIGATA
jgi:hypothetical protein